MRSRLFRLELAKLQVDRLDLALQHCRLELQVQVQHGLRLARERLGLRLLCLLLLSQVFEVSVTIGRSESVVTAHDQPPQSTHACSDATSSRNCPIVAS